MVFLIPVSRRSKSEVKMAPMGERRGDWGQMALISRQTMKTFASSPQNERLG